MIRNEVDVSAATTAFLRNTITCVIVLPVSKAATAVAQQLHSTSTQSVLNRSELV